MAASIKNTTHRTSMGGGRCINFPNFKLSKETPRPPITLTKPDMWGWIYDSHHYANFIKFLVIRGGYDTGYINYSDKDEVIINTLGTKGEHIVPTFYILDDWFIYEENYYYTIT